MTTVVYNRSGFDGVKCLDISRKFLPRSTKIIGWTLGDPKVPIPKSGKLYVLDLPLDKPFGISTKDLHRQFNYASPIGAPPPLLDLDVIWIDNHKNTIKSHPIQIPGIRVSGVPSSILAQKWFSDFKPNQNNLCQKKY